MTDSIVIQQATRLLAQIIEDNDRLQKEFLDLNLEELLEGKDDLKVLTITNLINIRGHQQVAFMFLEGLKTASRTRD